MRRRRYIEMPNSRRTTVVNLERGTKAFSRAVLLDGKYEGRVDEICDIVEAEYISDFIGPLQRYQRRKPTAFRVNFRASPKEFHLRVNSNKQVVFKTIEAALDEAMRTFPGRRVEIRP
jgi:hypothetical protein